VKKKIFSINIKKMSIPHLLELEYFTRFLYSTDAPQLIIAYLDAPDQTKYEAMQTSLRAILTDETLSSKITIIPNEKNRIVISNADSDVVFDSNKTVEENTHALANSKSINTSNHFSRFPIAKAILSNNGIGHGMKLSGSTGKKEIRHSTRLGKTPEEAIGVVSVSIVVL
jgi:hypothetical protein